MKQEYISPEMEIVEFDSEDVITTSNPSDSSNSSENPMPWIPLG